MELEHSFTIPVPPRQAWEVLLDVEQIAPCMPGASIDGVDGDVVSGRIKVKVGPIALTYAGTARFTERDERSLSVTLEASGKETRGSGTAAATVRSSLTEEDGQTRVRVHTTMSVTGRPAQLGRGVMAEVGGRIIEKFSSNLAAQLATGASAGPAPGGAGGPVPGAEGGAAEGGAAGAEDGAAGATAEVTSANGSGPAAGPAATSGLAATSVPIEELNLPVRSFNSLRREGLHTVGQVAARSEQELLAIDGLGPRSVGQIRQKLADRGLTLAGTTAGTTPAGPGEHGRTAGPQPGGTPVRPPLRARPPDEDAIDLLSVAGIPVLKRAAPVAGVLAAVLVLLLIGRRFRRRRRAAST